MTLDHRVGLYEACRRISPIHPDYAATPIQEGFDWSSCLAGIAFEQLYLVVFRSVRRAAADLELLREHDDRAYAEALEAGGLLRYFRGNMNERRECLSFCLGESRERARLAAGGASHREASGITAQMYRSYLLERYDLMRDEAGGSYSGRSKGPHLAKMPPAARRESCRKPGEVSPRNGGIRGRALRYNHP